ncbi:RAMP superfamily CRISPR-associated protein [Virgibacillus proomii]|uniref:RAMP superfamily CRISPR-associated protein n=1 Tax=Virgibacillus proomii TaxID=84407 RepID=UPI001C112269|nr:RAMP superfamily CRISPR-associated protein [Virgibacillus proomii]MBU5266436.1 hypothetical protein [Virgibacillus proomii]
MPKYELTITLQSDLSPGSGDSIAGVVDHDITHEYGLPIIPAKRIKGALRGVAKDLVDWQVVCKCDVDKLFGKPGQQFSSGFKLYDAKLADVPANYFENDQAAFSVDYHMLLAAAKKYGAAKILPLFTMLYTKTATEKGQAETGSLRTIRVINRGLMFKSVMELKDRKQEELLDLCAKGLRHLGYGRTRGLGEVKCKLKKLSVETGIKHNISIKKNDLVKQTKLAKQAIRITLQQPALLAGSKGLYYSCMNFVPGSALLGVFATLYIKKHNLRTEAHKDKRFARLFLRGDVSFGYAYPEVEGKVFMPCPAHIQRVKNGDRAMLENKKTETKIVLRKINSLAYIEESANKLWLYEPEKEFRMHHSRPEDRRIGRAVNDTKGADILEGEKGQFYYYTALSKGQSFVGELKGKQEDIEMLISLLEEVDHTIHLGRSRTAEYGAAKVEVIDKKLDIEAYKAQPEDQQVAIYLVTPLTLQNEVGRYVIDVELLTAQMERKLGVPLKVEKTYLKETVLTGYNAKWCLPKQEKPALDAGTVLLVSTEDQVDWSMLKNEQWGEETSQGCGEIRVLKYENIPDIFDCESVTLKADPLTDSVYYIDCGIEKYEKERRDRKKAICLAKAKANELKQYSKTKIYQLKEYVDSEKRALEKGDTKDNEKITLPKDFPEVLKKFADDELIIKSEVFVETFFHTIKLEVRKDAKETNQK